MWPAIVEYATAFGLVWIGTVGLVVGVAWARSRGHPGALGDEVLRFAESAPGIMSAALVSAVVLTVVALVGARFEARDVIARLRLQPTLASPVGMVAAVLATSGVSVACGAASDWIGARGHGNLETIARSLERLTPAQLAVAVATIALAPGIAEETFFRGLLQPRLVARWGRTRGIVFTAAAFGLIHVDIVQGSVAFMVGLLLGWLADRFGGIRPAMAAHAFNNALFVVVASRGATPGASRGTDATAFVAGMLLAIAAVVVVKSRSGGARATDVIDRVSGQASGRCETPRRRL